MRPITQVLSAGGAEDGGPIPIDQYQGPTNIGMAVVIGATATFQVEHTFDDIFDPAFNPATATWFDHPTLLGAASLDGNLAFPPRAVRITLSANTGDVTFHVVQSGAVG